MWCDCGWASLSSSSTVWRGVQRQTRQDPEDGEAMERPAEGPGMGTGRGGGEAGGFPRWLLCLGFCETTWSPAFSQPLALYDALGQENKRELAPSEQSSSELLSSEAQ